MMYFARVCAGTTFGATPPSVTIPWIRSVERICCRSNPSAVCAIVSASAALMPSSGNADACDSFPVQLTSNIDAAMIFAFSMSNGAGCTIIAA